MPKVIDLKELKSRLKDAKAAEREAKKDITTFQKAFLEILADTEHDPADAKEAAAHYRSSVADHIKAAKARAKLETKVGAASE